MALQPVPIFDSKGVPVKGMRSAPTPSLLPPGFFAQLTNFRFDNGNLYMRDGLLGLRGALTGVLQYQGSWHGFLNSIETAIVAFDFSDSTRVFSINLSTYAYTEITAASGRNGDTRLTKGNYCCFTAIAVPVIGDPPSATDALVIQNGVDSPRVYDPTQATQPVAINQPINLPNPQSAYCFLDYQGQQLNYQPYNATSTAFWAITSSNSGVFNLAPSTGIYGSGGAILSVTTGATSNPTITMVNSNGTGELMGNIYSFGIVCNGAANPTLQPLLAWDNIKVQIKDDTTGIAETVWDPLNQVGTAPAYLTNLDPVFSGTYMVAYTMPSYFSALGTDKATTIIFTYVGPAPTTSYSLEILGFATTAWSNDPQALHGIQGSTQFGYSWVNSQSRGESAGSVISTYLTTTGATFTGAAEATWSIPNSPLLFFGGEGCGIVVPNVSATEISQGVDTVYVYFAPPGAINDQITSVESQFIFLGEQQINTYSGSWPTGNAGKMEGVSSPFTLYGLDRDAGLVMPDGYAQTIPIGMSMLTSGAYLVVGGVGENQNQVWYSWNNLFTRFESQVQFLQQGVPNDASATINQYTGEVVTAITKVGGIYTGIDPTIIFTNAAVYRTDLINVRARSQHTRLGKHGLPFSRSYTESENILYWIDSERQVMMLVPGGVPLKISKKKVDDKLVSANLTNAPFMMLHTRLFVAYGPNGASENTNLLVYETWERLMEWCEDVPAGGIVAAGLLQLNQFSGRIGWMFDNIGSIYQVEAPNQETDAGSAYTGTLTTPRYIADWRKWLTCGPVVVCTDQSTAQLSVTRSWMNADTPAGDGIIPLGVAGQPFAWIQESSEPNNPSYGGRGTAVQITIQGELPGGFNIYAASVLLGAQDQDGFSSNV